MFFLSMAFAQDPIHPEPLRALDQDWLVWVGTNPPRMATYRYTILQKRSVQNPSESRSYPDRLLSYSTSELTRQNQWHAYLKAPYSLYTREIFEEKLPERKANQKKTKNMENDPIPERHLYNRTLSPCDNCILQPFCGQ